MIIKIATTAKKKFRFAYDKAKKLSGTPPYTKSRSFTKRLRYQNLNVFSRVSHFLSLSERLRAVPSLRV